jgi:hypothetical protein
MLSPNETEFNLENSFESEAKEIPGLAYIPDYINLDEQNQLLNAIDQQEWSTKLKRRVQHYGYRYDYKNGSLASSKYLGALPDWAQSIASRLYDDGLTPKLLIKSSSMNMNQGKALPIILIVFPALATRLFP